ncbi:MAG: hypothetical protein JO260_03935 [Acidobacteria bacterium]|nr:hypothetical protein [Acidobacteriota bacterium]
MPISSSTTQTQLCAQPAARSARPASTSPATAPSVARKHVAVRDAFLGLLREPVQRLVYRWNWKSAVLSSLLRATLFFATNLTAGLPAAFAAMRTELVFRAVTSGFYGALTENFRGAEPPWAAAITVMILLPIANHSLEFVVHWLRGTRNLASSIVASVVLTAFSTLFNLFVMRRGALIVGEGRRSLASDLAQMPRLVGAFCLLLPRYCYRKFRERRDAGPSRRPQ